MSTKRCMGGRKAHPYYGVLLYDFTKLDNGKAAAYCRVCARILKNTSQQRMKQHRKACPPKADDPDSSYCNDFLIKDEDTSEQTASKSASHTRAKIEKRSGKDPLFLSDENGHFVEMDDSEPLASLIKQEEPDPPKTVSNSVTSTYIPTTGTSHHMPKDHQQLDVELAKFFYGCNIPFSVAESDHFKTFIKLLRPSYQPPSPNTLSARLLDTMYADLLYSNAKVIPSETTLLLEMSSLSNIVTMLQTADGMCMYLESFNYANLMGKTGEALAKACEKARELAKERHNADIFAVVSAHSRDIADRSKSNLWHCVCSTYEGNLLANELNEQRVLNKLTKIVAEFKSNEKLLIDSGGTRILMADNGRSLSAFDSMNSLLENLTYMRDLANETNEVSDEITTLLFDEDFIQMVRDNVRRVDPVAELIKKCQTANYSIADSTENWLELCVDDSLLDAKMQAAVRNHRNCATSVYGLTANFLHPVYRGTKLDGLQMDLVDDFLLSILDVNGLDSLMEFRNDTGMFKCLHEKGVLSPFTFWGFLERKHTELSRLAMKLLKIPASLLKSNHIDTQLSFVHTNAWNKLNFEQNSKLLHCYYSLKLMDSQASDQY